MSKYIDSDLLKKKWLFHGKDGKPYCDEIDAMSVVDVVSKEKYDELNEKYHRLLENAKILADVVRDYER